MLYCVGQDLGGVPFEVFVQIRPQIVKPSQALRELATQIWPKLGNIVNQCTCNSPLIVFPTVFRGVQKGEFLREIFLSQIWLKLSLILSSDGSTGLRPSVAISVCNCLFSLP